MVNCSRCGNREGLSLVTVLYEEGANAGRALVYCEACKADMMAWIGEAIPLEKVSPAVFLDLYRTGKTASDPFTAVELVFGRKDADLVRQAQALLNTNSGA
ncbi:hypothetical protein [Alcanivorax sp.]|jgi:hypothetical protein|uniref:hypothetical protein n=1 Tax=Alcanivorax sp. TaxID=1872427 RepID=UPI0032D951E5